jgi:CCR4-NOT transcription complex subunit 2
MNRPGWQQDRPESHAFIGLSAGQPQQRPPNLAPNPGLAGPFRGPYPSYGMPPRSVIQSYVPALPTSTHRTAAQQSQTQTMAPQPSPGFIQQRGQSSFPFSGTLGQVQAHQPSSTPQQHSSSTQPSSQLQQQANGTSSSVPPHLLQSSTASSLTPAAPSVSSANEALDLNDFPALGSTPLSVSTPTANAGNGATSYASQAGTSVPLGGAAGASSTGSTVAGTGTTGSINQPRDFTPDDFPALGGQTHPPTQSQTQNTPSSQSQETHSHPPGLNGFQHGDHSQQHRQNLLGALGGSSMLQQGTPGMLNLGPAQSRNVHPGFQQGTEVEKQQQRVSFTVNFVSSNRMASLWAICTHGHCCVFYASII